MTKCDSCPYRLSPPNVPQEWWFYDSWIKKAITGREKKMKGKKPIARGTVPQNLPDDPSTTMILQNPFVEGFIDTWCGKLDLHNRQPTKVIRDMKHHTQHLLFQFVSKGNAHLLHSRNQKSPYQGFFWRSEVHVRSLRIRIVSHRVVCALSVGLVTSLLFWVFFFTDSRGSTVYIFLYVSFA